MLLFQGSVYLDTNAIIAIIELRGGLNDAQRDLMKQIDEGAVAAVTSELTLMECLVKPLADKDAGMVRRYMELFSGQPALSVHPVTREVLLEGARSRAETGLKLPDAIHLATAKVAGCATLVSNDKRFASAWPRTYRYWSALDAV